MRVSRSLRLHGLLCLLAFGVLRASAVDMTLEEQASILYDFRVSSGTFVLRMRNLCVAGLQPFQCLWLVYTLLAIFSLQGKSSSSGLLRWEGNNPCDGTWEGVMCNQQQTKVVGL